LHFVIIEAFLRVVEPTDCSMTTQTVCVDVAPELAVQGLEAPYESSVDIGQSETARGLIILYIETVRVKGVV